MPRSASEKDWAGQIATKWTSFTVASNDHLTKSSSTSLSVTSSVFELTDASFAATSFSDSILVERNTSTHKMFEQDKLCRANVLKIYPLTRLSLFLAFVVLLYRYVCFENQKTNHTSWSATHSLFQDWFSFFKNTRAEKI